MVVVVDVKGQELSLRSQTSQLVEGSKDFIHLHFNFLDKSWDQFKGQGTRSLKAIISYENIGSSIEQNITNNEAIIPAGIPDGYFTIKLRGTSGDNDEVIGISNCLELLMNDENTILEYVPEKRNYMKAKQEIKSELSGELTNNLTTTLTDSLTTTLTNSLTTTLTSSVTELIKNDLAYTTNLIYALTSGYIIGVGISSTEIVLMLNVNKVMPKTVSSTTVSACKGKILGRDNSNITYTSGSYSITSVKKSVNGILITIKTTIANGFSDYLNKLLIFQISDLKFTFNQV